MQLCHAFYDADVAPHKGEGFVFALQPRYDLGGVSVPEVASCEICADDGLFL